MFLKNPFSLFLCLLRLNLWVAVCVETTCTTACSELQCRRSETQNASRPTPVTVHRKPGGKRFWPHRLPHTALEHPETVEIRAPKSKWNKLKSAENRYKRAEKVFPISLGAGCRRFALTLILHSQFSATLRSVHCILLRFPYNRTQGRWSEWIR